MKNRKVLTDIDQLDAECIPAPCTPHQVDPVISKSDAELPSFKEVMQAYNIGSKTYDIIDVPKLIRPGFSYAYTHHSDDPIALRFFAAYKRMPVHAEFPFYYQVQLLVDSMRNFLTAMIELNSNMTEEELSKYREILDDDQMFCLQNNEQFASYVNHELTKLAELYIRKSATKDYCKKLLNDVSLFCVAARTSASLKTSLQDIKATGKASSLARLFNRKILVDKTE